MKLELVPHDHPVLRTPCEKFDFDDPPHDPVELAPRLAEVMLRHRALGLAAPQVGLPLRVIAIASNPVGVLFNPVIVDRSSATTDLEESCLSFPGLTLRVVRPRVVRVRYTLPNGDTQTKQFTDMTARVICHEVDHLDGISIVETQTGLRRDVARKKWAKIVKRGVPERIVPGVVDIAEMTDNIRRVADATAQR